MGSKIKTRRQPIRMHVSYEQTWTGTFRAIITRNEVNAYKSTDTFLNQYDAMRFAAEWVEMLPYEGTFDMSEPVGIHGAATIGDLWTEVRAK